VTPTTPACDSLSLPGRIGEGGGNYSPYFISRFTSGDSVQKTSTFFFVISTWNPYEVVIMKASIQAVTTADVSLPGPSGPFTFDLQQNYPNPFNPSTVVSYQLPADSDVRLSVYDLLGHVVATIVNGRQMAGAHTVRFSPQEWGAGGLASGMYVIRLQAGSYVAVRKMAFVK
jgi:hypothetical protein